MPKAPLKKRVTKARVRRARAKPIETQEIAVDRKLEETGVATVPDLPLPEDHKRPIPLQSGRECAKCHRRVPMMRFQPIRHSYVDPETGEKHPLIRDGVCKACRAEERAADHKTVVRDRAVQREKVRLAKKDAQTRRKESFAATVARKREIRQEAKLAREQDKQAKVRSKKQRDLTNLGNEVAEGVQREVARRELARRKLLYFTRRFEGQQVDSETGELVDIQRAKGKGYDAGWVHQDICARLERFYAAVRRGEQPRLMLFMPPRHGKSTLASRMFPGWVMGQDATTEIVAASYGASLPEQFSRFVRGLLRDPEYQAIFPDTRLNPEQENIQGWATTVQGQYIPVGVGSGVTGRGADILIIDDPFKGAEDAENPNQRDKVLDWYFSEAVTRLSPKAGVLIILTRWHDEDLAGALINAQETQEKESREILDEELASIDEELVEKSSDWIQARALAYIENKERLVDVEKWEVVSYAAIAETDEYRLPDGRIMPRRHTRGNLLRKRGEALHPSRYPIETLRRIRRGLFSRGRERFWHALYQQKPVPDEGVHFSKDMVHVKTVPPEAARGHYVKCSAWDLAAGQKQQHDFTVGARGEMDHNGVVYVTGLIRGRFNGANGIAEQIINDFEAAPTQMIGIERGPLEQIVMPSVTTLLETRNKKRSSPLTPVFAQGKKYGLTPITDLVMCARPLQSLMQQGKVIFSPDLPFMEETVQELLRFPGGAHDDIVAALSWLVRLLLKFPTPREPLVRVQQKSWKDRLRVHTRGQRSAMGA